MLKLNYFKYNIEGFFFCVSFDIVMQLSPLLAGQPDMLCHPIYYPQRPEDRRQNIFIASVFHGTL